MHTMPLVIIGEKVSVVMIVGGESQMIEKLLFYQIDCYWIERLALVN